MSNAIASMVPVTYPRLRWLRGLLVFFSLYVLINAAVYVCWRHEAARRLEQLLASYTAAGQPVSVAELGQTRVPDEQNGALRYRKAVEKLVRWFDENHHLEDFADDPGRCLKEFTITRHFVEANREALTLISEARHLPDADFAITISDASSASGDIGDRLRGLRELVRLLQVAVTYEHGRGNDEAAIDYVLDDLALSRASHSAPATLIQHLYVIAFDAWATSTVEVLLSPRRGDESESSNSKSPALREKLRALLAELQQERWLIENCSNALRGERVLLAEGIKLRQQVTAPNAFFEPVRFKFLIEPGLTLDLAFALRYISTAAEACDSESLPLATKRMPRYPRRESFASQLIRVGSADFLPALDRVPPMTLQQVVERRLATTAIAIRLFEIDHGVRPAALANLVPDYLREIPIDVMSKDQRPIAYVPVGPPALLYSVGEDGIDESGHSMRDRRADPEFRWADDVLFYLDGDRAPPFAQYGQDAPSSSRPTNSEQSPTATQNSENE